MYQSVKVHVIVDPKLKDRGGRFKPSSNVADQASLALGAHRQIYTLVFYCLAQSVVYACVALGTCSS